MSVREFRVHEWSRHLGRDWRRASAIWTVFLLWAVVAVAEDAVTEIRVFPDRVSLTDRQDKQRLIVQARLHDGRTRDVTGQAQWRLLNRQPARLTQHTLRPMADGTTSLQITYAGQTRSVPVEVKRSAVELPVSFSRDVMPVFLRAGCNRGTCHGASRGQRGFRLSVFGFDPDGDYHRLTREFVGRRINLAVPEESLLLLKATEEVAHGGGERFTVDSEPYQTVLKWLESGAAKDTGEVARPVAVEIYPPEVVLDGGSQRFLVRARYSDGTDRDVTAMTVFSSSNPTAAAITAEGVLNAGKRGESFVLARFDSFSVGVPVIVIAARTDVDWTGVTAHNYIDQRVQAKLKKLRVLPSAVCDDATYLRRVSIDTIGLLPTRAEYHAFLADSGPNKRRRLVERLLQRPEFTDLWVAKWAELLQIDRIKGGFFGWLAKNYNANVGIDQMVRELLTAEGGFFRDPPVQYFRRVGEPTKLAENVAQVFMGTRIQCARCHNHPFDRWTMDDYYSFAAFFAQLGSKRNWEDTRELIVFDKGAGEVRHPQDQRVMPPKLLGGAVPQIQGRDRRAILAEWLTAADNPWFASNLANRIWAQYFGRGIVGPVDDVRVSNPPSNPALLDALSRHLVDYQFDFRRLILDIATSRTYQQSVTYNDSNRHDMANFSHASFRRLRAEVLHDCLCQVTDSPTRLGGFPLGTRAVQMPVASMTTYFLETFGRSDRETVCTCEVDVEPSLSQALHLINGETTWGKIRRGGLVTRLLAKYEDPRRVLEELYIRCLTRKPTVSEMEDLARLLEPVAAREQVMEEIFWALLNSKEFLFNH